MVARKNITIVEVDEQTPLLSPHQDDDKNETAASSITLVVFPILLAGIFLSNVVSSVVIATNQRIASEFNALSSAAWLLTIYTLAQSASQPLYGKLSDIYGRKVCLVFCWIVFGIGCLLVAVGQSYWHLLLGRAVSGVGSAGKIALTSIIVADVIPLPKVAQYRGYVNLTATIARSLGGPIGGWLAGSVGWRWPFLIQLPVALAGLALVLWKLPEPKEAVSEEDADSQLTGSKISRVDFAGAATLVATVLTGLLSLDFCTKHDLGLVVYSLVGAFVLSLSLFCAIEKYYAKEPILPLELVFKREVLTSYSIVCFQAAGQFGLLYTIPIYFQVVGRESIASSSSRIVPVVVGNAFGTITSQRLITKTQRYKGLTAFGNIVGLNIGVLMGASISTATINYALRHGLETLLRGIDGRDEIIKNVTSNVEYTQNLPDHLWVLVSKAYIRAIACSNVLSVGCITLALAVTLTMREKPLGGRTTYEEASPALSQQDDDWDPSYDSNQEPPPQDTRQTPRFSPEISTTSHTPRGPQQRNIATRNEQQQTHNHETIRQTDAAIRQQILTTYLESMHRRVPFCDYTEILQTNESSSDTTVSTDVDRVKLLRLYMSLAIGAAVMQLTGVSPGPRPEIYFSRALELQDEIEGTDLVTQTEILLWTVLYKLRACFSSEVWYLIGSAVRTAIDADLHREHHYTNLAPAAAERQRWTTICYVVSKVPSLWTPARANDLRVCSSSLYAAAERNPAIRKYCDTLDTIIEVVSEYVEQVLSTPASFNGTGSAISSPAEDKSPRNAFERLGNSLKELKFEFPSHAYPEYRLEDGHSEAACVHADINLDAIGIFGDVDFQSREASGTGDNTMATQVFTRSEAATPVEASPNMSTEKIPEGQPSSEAIIVADWTPKAESHLRRKLDFTILPMLMLGLFALQLDKGNLSYALTTSFTKDLGIDNNNVNYGNQLMLAAIVVFEIPFNMVLSRIGPALWLTIQIFAWGTVATAQTAIHNLAGFYSTRFILGMWEAGYLAASLTILASFYTRREMAMRVTLVYIGNYFSSGIGGLLAGAIFKIPESSGLKKWQWLFLIDGLFTFVVGIAFIFLMPRSTDNTTPLCGLKSLNFFNDEERRILNDRVILDDPRKTVRLEGIGPKRVLQIVFTSFRIWGHFGVNVISLTPKGGLGVYSPTIIKNLGFDATTASFLSSVHNFGVCIFAITVAWISDKTSRRGLLCLICAVYSIIFSGVQYAVVRSSDVWLKYAILTVLTSGMAVSQSINDAWFSVNTAHPQERCIGLALAVAGSNLGGLCGQNIFVKSDAPYYYHGFLKVLCIYAGSVVLIAGLMVYYWNENRKLEKETIAGELVTEHGVSEIGRDGGKSRVKNQL
ncbi:hypothetical protein Neosp_009545 [[Neocosmospora] mangrovei]